jgi:queuosine precursor transporter
MIWLLGYLGTIVAANWAITTFGVVPVAPGVLAPAAVFFAGLAFTLRDLLQDALGKRAVLGAIAGGALLSALFSPQLALASGVAFGLSELADLAVYTPLRARAWPGAVVASNVVGSIVDSVLFLSLAFGSLNFLAGQLIGKWEMTLIALPLAWWIHQRRAAAEPAPGL